MTMHPLAELAASMLQEQARTLPSVVPADPAPASALSVGTVLAIEDILTDLRGEAVLAPEPGIGAIVLAAAEPVVDQGAATAHVTAAGEDVSGLAYVAFASGVTVYYPAEVELLVTGPGG